MLILKGYSEFNHFTTTHLKMKVAKSSFALAFTPLKHRLCILGGLNDEYSYEIMDSDNEVKTRLNIFDVDFDTEKQDLIKNVSLSHSKFRRCANILPFACVQGGAVFLDETNVFIVFGGLGKGTKKAGILNIDKGRVTMVSDMLFEDICKNGVLYKLEYESTVYILLMGIMGIQLYSLKNDEWYDIGNIKRLDKYGIDGRWISFVEISENFYVWFKNKKDINIS